MENPPTPETGHGPQHTSPQRTSHSLRLALHQMFLRSLRRIIVMAMMKIISQSLLTPKLNGPPRIPAFEDQRSCKTFCSCS